MSTIFIYAGLGALILGTNKSKNYNIISTILYFIAIAIKIIELAQTNFWINFCSIMCLVITVCMNGVIIGLKMNAQRRKDQDPSEHSIPDLSTPMDTSQ